MHNVYLNDLLRIYGGILVNGNPLISLDNFSIDTRTINKNDVFVGIKGEKFDGSTKYIDALEKGARGCILNDSLVIDKDIISKYPDAFIVLVDDTIKCIQELARYKRNLYNIPVVAITGSVGKTSTKDIITSVLKEEYNVLSTTGNYNNHIGVPLTILKLKDENCAVIEMGMNNLGEISILSHIAKPTVSIITNIGTAHIGNLGSRENILKAKLEILDGMNVKKLIINNDNDLLHSYYLENNNYQIITYGVNNDSNYTANEIKCYDDHSIYNILIDGLEEKIKINIPGEAFIYNSLCAIAIGRLFNIDIKKIKLGIENFILTGKRMEIESINKISIINDSYNANVDSMNNAINYLGTLKGKKIAVLGDMLELGEFSEYLHRSLANTIISNKIDYVITIGNESKFIKDELNKNNYQNVYSYDNAKDALVKLKEIADQNDNILFKASNSMNFNDLCLKFKEIIK